MDSGVAISPGVQAESPRPGFTSDVRWQAALILAAIAGLSATLWLIPMSSGQAHAIVHHLYFLPLIFAGRLFGWRKASLISVLAFALQAPHYLRAVQGYPVRAVDNAFELATFGIAAIITGYLSDRERRQREHIEKTKRELEGVYEALRQNVEKLKKAERLSAAGQLSAGLAHEIRNPLASIAGAAGILKRGQAPGDDLRDCLEIIDKESQRLNKLLTSFLEFARPRAPRFQATDLAAVVDSVCALASHQTGAGTVELRREMDGSLPEILCDPEQIKQVLLNLVLNAIQASPAGGVVVVRVFTAEGNAMVVEVGDEGRGIPEELRTRIFEPFFTTKEHGTGLGLAVAAKIVDQHGGSISAVDGGDGGATLRITLPLRQEATR